jgi:hypothetical protein
MKIFLLTLFAIVCTASAAPSEPLKMPAEVRKAVQNGGKFREIRKVVDLPAGVLKALTNGGNIMANPGEDWQVTDVIDPGKNLPGRRLIWAASDGTHCLVHFETGGIAHVFHMTVLELGKDAPRELWSYSGRPLPELKDLSSFLEAVGKK